MAIASFSIHVNCIWAETLETGGAWISIANACLEGRLLLFYVVKGWKVACEFGCSLDRLSTGSVDPRHCELCWNGRKPFGHLGDHLFNFLCGLELQPASNSGTVYWYRNPLRVVFVAITSTTNQESNVVTKTFEVIGFPGATPPHQGEGAFKLTRDSYGFLDDPKAEKAVLFKVGTYIGRLKWTERKLLICICY